MNWLVSIIIPVYNRASFIGETLNSVISQTYSLWECIIVDDGSTDGTMEIIKDCCKKDSRIKIYSRPPHKSKGASSCRNYGIEIAEGDFIQFLDSDDLLHKNKLWAQLKVVDRYDNDTLFTGKWGGFENPKDLVSRFKQKYYSYRTFNKNLKLLNCFGFYNEFFPLHVYLIPRDLIRKAGFWNEELSNNDDAEFFTRVILNSSRVVFVPNASVYYRYSSSNKLSSFDSKDKLVSAINSWKLIDENVKKVQPGYTSSYTKNAAWNIFKIAQEQYPEILNDHADFFRLRKNFNNRFFSIKNLNNIKILKQKLVPFILEKTGYAKKR